VRSLNNMADDKIIPFPSEKVKYPERLLHKSDSNKEFSKKVRLDQTKKFVEGAVDDISMNLLKHFVDLAMKTEKPNFTKDLALLVDVMRGMIYRDFGIKHPAQQLADKMVELKTNRSGSLSAKLDYSTVIDKKHKVHKPISNDVKEELNDLKDGIIFEPDGDLDD
tara:strand:+ start:1752 stop:2246 length:495 start_codon:yes stop_codon:yes gene_type:complete